MTMEAVEDNPREVSHVSFITRNKGDKTSKSALYEEIEDPFEKFVKDIDGLGHNFKRSVKRKMEKAYTGVDGAESKKIEIEVTGYNYLEVIYPPYDLHYLAQLMEISAANAAAVQAKASNVVGLGWNFVETPATNNRLTAAADDAARDKIRQKLAKIREQLNNRLEALNADDTFEEVLRKVYVDYEATGMGYFEVGRIANGPNKGEIGYLGHIPSVSLRVRRKRDGFVQIISNRAVYFRNFGENTPNPIGDDNNPNEIIQIKKYTPTNSFYGVPDIISAKNAVAGTEFAARYNLDYFENKAVPRHLIILKGASLSTSAETNMLEFFETNLKGKHHRSMFIPLPPDTPEEKVTLEIKPIEAGGVDQSFDNYKKANLLEVLMAHRVPINKVSAADGMAQATAMEASKTFKNEVCIPEQKMVAKKINKVFKEFTNIFLLEFNELTLTDADTQSKIEERQIRNQIRVPNEIRSDHGWPGIPGGDKIVELKPQQAADAKATAGKTRARDTQRAADSTSVNANGKSPNGAGRTEG
jgi:PBSX family phage portal protein